MTDSIRGNYRPRLDQPATGAAFQGMRPRTKTPKSEPDHAPIAAAVRKGLVLAPLVVAEGPPPRQPVAFWEELARELDADREEP